MTHVLAVRLDSDGDVLLTGPAVRAIAAGGARVTYCCAPGARAAAALLPGVDDIVAFEAPWISADPPPVRPEAMLAVVDRLGGIGADQAIVFTSFHQSPLPTALLLRLAGVPVVAAISVDYPGSLLDIRHAVPDDIHEVERNLSLVATLGHRLGPGDDGRLRLRPSGRVRTDLPAPAYVVVHPGASVPARALRPELADATASALVAAGHCVVVTGGPREGGIVAAHPRVTDLSGRTDLAELAAVIAGADAIVVGNTGPAHLAAAVGTPVVSVFAPTVPARRWRPWRVPHVLLGDQTIGCAGCRSRRCPLPGQPCTAGVTAAEVVAAVDRLARPRAAA
jgi:ADP-heptose:LPS heptosyltransferase